ncbi:MAG: NUDIX domain-containing protein [Neisseria sp.]|nr:NUDIX domain-containing protein [Neisseria sp.]
MPLSPSLHERLFTTLKARFATDMAVFTPLLVRDIHLGFVNTQYAQLLRRDLGEYIRARDGVLRFNCDSWLQAADLLQNAAWGWHESGLYSGWRNEPFTVHDDAGNPLFSLERSAFRPLGFLSHAVHINGWIERDGQRLYWIGTRSPYKAVDPNKLDNLVGGGIAAGEDIATAMRREAFEEAGLPPELLRDVPESGCRLSCRPVSRGLHREYLHVFDVHLPADFVPQNQDGEVASFALMNVSEIAEAMSAGQFMNDAALALLDAFARNGELDPTHPLGAWLDNLAQVITPAA